MCQLKSYRRSVFDSIRYDLKNHEESSDAKTMESELVSKGHGSKSSAPQISCKVKLQLFKVPPWKANAATLYSRIARWSVFGCEAPGDALGGEEITSMVMDKIPLKVVTTCTFSEFA